MRSRSCVSTPTVRRPLLPPITYLDDLQARGAHPRRRRRGLSLLFHVVVLTQELLRGDRDAAPGCSFPTELHFENYAEAWSKAPWARYFANTLLIVGHEHRQAGDERPGGGVASARMSFKASRRSSPCCWRCTLTPAEATRHPELRDDTVLERQVVAPTAALKSRQHQSGNVHRSSDTHLQDWQRRSSRCTIHAGPIRHAAEFLNIRGAGGSVQIPGPPQTQTDCCGCNAQAFGAVLRCAENRQTFRCGDSDGRLSHIKE